MNPDDFYDVGLYILIFGILGARLYYVIFSWDYYKDNLSSIFNIRQGGLAIYGGLIAGFATMIIYCIRKKKNMFAMMDVGVLGVLVGQILGRWGNFMNREAFGDYSDGLFAMRLPSRRRVLFLWHNPICKLPVFPLSKHMSIPLKSMSCRHSTPL